MSRGAIVASQMDAAAFDTTKAKIEARENGGGGAGGAIERIGRSSRALEAGANDR